MDIIKKRPELFLPVKSDDDSLHEKFTSALFIAFDIPDDLKEIRHQICNRDLLWLPSELKKKKLNFFQIASLDTDEREPIESCFSYFFKPYEPYYSEPYNFSKEEKEELSKLHEYLKTKYVSPDNYLKNIAETLWLPDWEELHMYRDWINYVWNNT